VSDRRALAVATPLLAVVTAVVVAVEFAVVGLLPAMARDLGVTLAQAGGLISAFAFAAAVLGPFLTLAVARFEPRPALAAASAIFGISNLAAVLAPDLGAVILARVVQGATLPVFISVGAAAIARLADPQRQGRAIAQVNVGTIVGLVLAVPAAAALAAATDWRTVFATLGVLDVTAAIALLMFFPSGLAAQPAGIARQASILRSPLFLSHLGLSATVFAATFAAYAYLAAFLEQEAGYGGGKVAAALMGFGAVGLAGNWIAGRVADRWPTPGTAVAVLTVGLAVATISIVGGRSGLLPSLLTIWGVAHAAGFVLCQVRVLRAGAEAPAFATALNIAACNLGIALGAQAGGMVIDATGLGGIGVGAACFALVALGLVALIGRFTPKPQGQAAFTPAASPSGSAACSAGRAEP
jgi:predicted MFS family arabinose efflux permease